MKKTALITGATSGIGLATAIRFAEEGINLILCGRRKDRLLSIQHQLSSKVNVHVLSFDVQDKKSVLKAISSIPNDFSVIDILINNAGNAYGLDSFEEGDFNDWDSMIDINLRGLLYVSKAIIKSMIQNKSGHIINIGSTAGKLVYPKGNVYCATKHAVDALTKGMRVDLKEHGIKVGVVHPGLTETEFSEVRFHGDKERANKVYKDIDALQPEDLADIIYFVVSRPYHVNISDLVAMPIQQV
jgi:3-hydroxy acid dehydrogenase/malonic semialdehyde reductase|tara:strand:- start:211 stop:939 length:729 start_codon:yes stop_codon:yes gene_type:complete